MWKKIAFLVTQGIQVHKQKCMEKRDFFCNTKCAWKESAGNVAGTETSLHWETQPKGNWPLTTEN